MSTFESAIDQLPKPILDKLQSMIRRVRRLLFIRGFFATLAVAVVCLLTIMAIDAAITIFSPTTRWALSLAGLGVTLVAAWWYLVRPLSRKFTLTHMARILEIRHPELQERISTAVELMGSDDPESIKGSEELIAAVVDSAVVDIEAVDPKAEFKPARSRKFLAVGVGALAILLLILAIWPKQSWTLLTRAVAPFLDIGNAYASSLIVDPGDVRVATGSPVTIEVSVKHKKLKRAEIRRLLADGSETVERMTLVGEDEDGTKRFSMTFPSVTENFDYRVRAGSAVSEFYDVDAVDPPIVEELRISYDYPEYTGLEDVSAVSETGEIRAIAHTKVKVEATLNRPIWSSKLFINEDREVELTESAENQISWEMELKSGTNGSWRIELADEEGFTNEPASFPIEALPDKAPTIQITAPVQREFKLKPTETLPIDAAITEDFGIADFTMLVTPDGAPAPTSIALSAPAKVDASGIYFGRASLNIASLNLEPHQKRIAVQLRAGDNRPVDYDGPGVGLSETIYITLDQKAKSLADQAIEAQKKEVTEKIQEAKRELERARDDMRRAEQELQRSDDVKPETRQRLDEFSEHTEKARDNLDEIAAELEQSIFQEQADRASKISDENLATAMEKADMIPVTDAKEERISEARESREEIEKSIKELDSLAKAMREADDEYRAISELNQLANKQQELAQNAKEWAEEAQKRAEQMAANAQEASKEQQQFDQAQQKELNQFKQKQNQVEKELGEMLKDNAAALSEVLEEQKEKAESMSAKAEALAKNQESLKEANKKATQSKEDQQEALKERLIEQLQAMQTQLAEDTSEAQKAAQASQENASPGKSSPEETSKSDSGDKPQESNPEESAAASESLAEAASKAAEAAGELAERKLEEATESALSASASLSDAADKSSESETTEANTESAQTAEGAPDSPTEADAASAAEMAANDPAAEGSASETPASESAADTAAESGEGNPPGETPSEDGAPLPAQLAQRQEAIAEQIAAVRDGNLQEALSLMEQALAAEADALQSEAEQFEQTMQNLSQNNAKSSADRAENALRQGVREAKEAANQLDQAQKQQAQAEAKGQVSEGELAQGAQQAMQRGEGDQAQSANQLAQAAQHLANTATNIGKTMEGLDPAESDERIASSDDLAEGFEEVSEASESSSAEEAAQQSQEAANSLQKLAQQAMQKLGQGQQGNQPPQDGEGQPQPNQELAGDPQSDNLNETGKKTADSDGSGVPPELLDMGINAEDWARFKGALTGGNATAIETELPAEYRELVGRYFQVIAKEAGKK
ncbi:MAG: hypothetical protein P1U86_20575 [Verrucomicrobiales bacterium]|nr:hypothetical protein [Verrucomicrobiales bacterium]